MITAMMLALAIQAAPDEDPPKYRFAATCVAVADIGAAEIDTVLRKPSLTRDDRVAAEQSAAIFARMSDRAKMAERTAASLESLPPAEQDRASLEQRRMFETAPGELRQAMTESCVHGFTQDFLPD